MGRLEPELKKAELLLEDGHYFLGYSFGYEAKMSDGMIGEVVFNTAMSGYQEILSDPSYTGQIVVMTYPLIGNYGINPKDMESRMVNVSGFIVHEFSETYSNWRSEQTIREFLQEKKIPALCDINTRALTTHIRNKGAMNALIFSPPSKDSTEREKRLAFLKSQPHIGDSDLVAAVSTKEKAQWEEENNDLNGRWIGEEKPNAKKKPLVVVLDLGCKQNILRNLKSRNCDVKMVPVGTSVADILAMKPDGVFLSNGPGDPAVVAQAPATVKELLGKMPIFGICMGHQILAEAIGAKTFKMKFGHHGANHPVLDKKSGRVMITSQNHGYAVDPESLPDYAEVTQVNLNDNTVAGMHLEKYKAFSTQYHPEACPGPRDSEHYFDQFVDML